MKPSFFMNDGYKIRNILKTKAHGTPDRVFTVGFHPGTMLSFEGSRIKNRGQTKTGAVAHPGLLSFAVFRRLQGTAYTCTHGAVKHSGLPTVPPLLIGGQNDTQRNIPNF